MPHVPLAGPHLGSRPRRGSHGPAEAGDRKSGLVRELERDAACWGIALREAGHARSRITKSAKLARIALVAI